MVQHMFLLLLAPVLILLGRPLELTLRALPPARPATHGSRVDCGWRRLTGPLPCLATFAAVVTFTHLPGIYDATLTHPLLHDAEHALYLLAGALMWWPILDGDPSPRRRLDGLGRLLYLIVAMMPMAVIGAYLNRHPTLVFSAYGPPARALGISAVTDQQQAGAIMWVLGGLFMVLVGLWAAMGAWWPRSAASRRVTVTPRAPRDGWRHDVRVGTVAAPSLPRPTRAARRAGDGPRRPGHHRAGGCAVQRTEPACAGAPGGRRHRDSPTLRPSCPRHPDRAIPRTRFPTSPALVAEGQSLYANGCSSCHGLALQGTPGVAPALRGVGPGPVDFYLSTGRMPLEQPREEPQRATPLYSRSQILALIAYVSSFGGPAAPRADPERRQSRRSGCTSSPCTARAAIRSWPAAG